jgi:glycosyltransferase involved in cell wall biosynthesis
MKKKPSRALYICYFGLREPLVQTQVIPYLLEIAKDRMEISLLTFEPDLIRSWTREQIAAEQNKLADKGIEWHHLPYHKRPSVPATFYDVVNGANAVRKLLRSEKYDLLHCRIHLPMLMAAIARKFSSHKPKLLFDIRGFFPEEYTDAGVWPKNGGLYRTAKRIEKWLLNQADGFVVLTEKAREILFPKSSDGMDKNGRPVEVIPCCVDLKRFDSSDDEQRQLTRSELHMNGRFVIAYVGSFGGWYLSDEMLDFFAAVRTVDPSVFILILTQRDTEAVADRLRSKGIDENDFLVRTALPDDIPSYLNAADAGISFIKRCYSKLASSPTKNAEYLAAGLPIVANSGIGDVDAQILSDGVGVLIDTFDSESYVEAFSRLKAMGNIREQCRTAARNRFDLESVGGERYRRLYKKLLCNDGD